MALSEGDFADQAYKYKGRNTKLPAKFTRAGWRYDHSLSDPESQVIVNKNGASKMLVRGTSNLKDVGTDAALFVGAVKHTDRYKKEQRKMNKYKGKYGKKGKIGVAGHSLGGSLADRLGKENKEVDSIQAVNPGEDFASVGETVYCSMKQNLKKPVCRQMAKKTTVVNKADVISGIGNIAASFGAKGPGRRKEVKPTGNVLNVLKTHSSSQFTQEGRKQVAKERAAEKKKKAKVKKTIKKTGKKVANYVVGKRLASRLGF